MFLSGQNRHHHHRHLDKVAMASGPDSRTVMYIGINEGEDVWSCHHFRGRSTDVKKLRCMLSWRGKNIVKHLFVIGDICIRTAN